MLNKNQIQALIPHRPPFLWIDRIDELETGIRCVASKYVDPAEAFFAGHFPGNAILPGVMLIEAAAQTAGVMMGSCGTESPSPEGKKPAGAERLLAAVNRFKFLMPVRPGSELRIEVKKVAEAGPMAYIEAAISVGGSQVAKGELAVYCA